MSEQGSGSVTFDRAAEYYDQTRGFPPGVGQQVAEQFVKSGRLGSTSRVLEIGVGTGRIALPLAGRVGEMVGVDLSRRMMGRLREKQSEERVTLIEADATGLPFGATGFDAVITVHVLHLIPDWQRVVHEIARVLKPDGALLVGQNERSADIAAFEPMATAWKVSFPSAKKRRVGVPDEISETFLLDMGWNAVGKVRIAYTYQQTPLEFFRRLEHRLYSESWLISDGEHEQAMVALTRALKENYPEPETPLTVETGFEIWVYRPPG